MVVIDRNAKKVTASLDDVRKFGAAVAVSMTILSGGISAGIAIATSRHLMDSKADQRALDSVSRIIEYNRLRMADAELRVTQLEALLPDLAEDVRSLVRFRCTDDGVTAQQLQRAGVDCSRGRVR